MAFLDFLRRRKQLPKQKTPQDIALEEARLNEGIKSHKNPTLIISSQLGDKIRAQIKAKETQMAAARARRIAKYNVRR